MSADSQNVELWAVHAQGPDDIYAAFDRKDAERHAARLNAIPTPAGISVSAVVIQSPWAEVEHWKNLAEAERIQKEEVGLWADQVAVRTGPVKVPPRHRLYLVPMEDTDQFNAACTAAYDASKAGVGPCGIFIAGHRALLDGAPLLTADTEAPGFKLPDRSVEYIGDQAHKHWSRGFNYALEEVRRLNSRLLARTVTEPDVTAEAVVKGTPSAQWRAAGEPDPHGDRYNCERAELCMGDLSDDELANGAFMNYDAPLNPQGILAGTHSSPIAWMTAVKDRIRWLSRSLEAAIAAGTRPSTDSEGGSHD